MPLSLTSETAILCINLLDINDNPPTFSVVRSHQILNFTICGAFFDPSLLTPVHPFQDDSYSVSQDEGTVPSNRLIQILATDADTIAENAMTNYSISEGNTSIFRITEVYTYTHTRSHSLTSSNWYLLTLFCRTPGSCFCWRSWTVRPSTATLSLSWPTTPSVPAP